MRVLARFLDAAGPSVPKQILAHGWLAHGQRQNEQALGNVVRPRPTRARLAVDALRYYLLAKPFSAKDGNFSYDNLVVRLTDLRMGS